MLDLLTPAEMSTADRLTIEGGTSGVELMERAGTAVADAASRWPIGWKIAIACGPGNNGGDGFVAARILADRGYVVTLGLLGGKDRLKGDAALAAARWPAAVAPLESVDFRSFDGIIDALFGAGLDRPLEGDAARAVEAINASGRPVLSIDLPSGIHGETGQVLGVAVRAAQSITFFRAKPGHYLIPGREYAGRLRVIDIGIADTVLTNIAPNTCLNRLELWKSVYPLAGAEGHKYTRGHAVIVSGGMTQTGAARMAARSALRIGAGLVTMASPADALAVNAAHLTAIMLKRMDGPAGLEEILSDIRLNSVILGPGLGPTEATRATVEAALRSEASVVLDADGLSAFRDAPDRLFRAIQGRKPPVVMTPHDGEFARLFPDLADLPGKLDRTRQAAKRSGAVMLLKGADTVVASPDGGASIADNAPPYLATAGAGDVLAGMIGGLLSQHMPAFDAASAAVWLHGEAAVAFGRGLIAEDLPDTLPKVLSRLFD